MPESDPIIFLPYQRAWISDTAQVKVCEKSRRVGITWAEAADCALNAASEDGMDAWYIGYNREMAREFIADASFWAEHYHLAASSMEQAVLDQGGRPVMTYVIRFASGRRITALSSRPANLRGKQGKVVIDEAAFHDDLPELLKAAVALLMWGGRVSIISTHNGQDNPFHDLVEGVRAGKHPYSLHRVTLDQALAQGLYQRICLKLGKPWTKSAEDAWRAELIEFYGDAAGEELFVVPRGNRRAYIPRDVIEACMDERIPVARLALDNSFAALPEVSRKTETAAWLSDLVPHVRRLPAHPTFLGVDFGRSGDLTVIFALQETPGLSLRSPLTAELRNVPFRQQEQVLFGLAEMLPNFSGAALDARGNGQYLAEVAAQRFGQGLVRQVMITADWYRENMPRYKAAFEDRAIIIPRDADILDDHLSLRVERGVARVPENARRRGRDGMPRHGDSAIAGALALFAAKSNTGANIISAAPWKSKSILKGY